MKLENPKELFLPANKILNRPDPMVSPASPPALLPGLSASLQTLLDGSGHSLPCIAPHSCHTSVVLPSFLVKFSCEVLAFMNGMYLQLFSKLLSIVGKDLLCILHISNLYRKQGRVAS